MRNSTLNTRTGNVLKNAKVALGFYCVNLVLQFFSRKVFLDYLGAELLGLNTTLQDLLQFLNLAESGIGAAIAFSLYKPLSSGNRNEINEIVSLQGWLYRWVALIVAVGAIILMAFFPYFFEKANVPLAYVYGTFFSFLISVLLGYLFNYKIIVLSADQKEYKITIQTQTIKVIKIFAQMVAIVQLPVGYVWWMALEVVASIVTVICLDWCIKKEYPWLKPNVSKGKQLQQKYGTLLLKTKQLFFHRIGGYVLSHTTPLIIYTFTTLSTVAIYANYLVILGGCSALVNAFSRGLNSSIGNLVAEKNNKQVKDTFWLIMTLRLCFAGMISSCFFLLSESFMTLWVGRDYTLPMLPVAIMSVIFFIQMSRTCDFFLSAYGLFQDIWAPILESAMSIGLSVLFGFFWGLSGILAGVLISQIIVVNSWKAVFLYRKGFNDHLSEYIFRYTKKILLLVVIFSSMYCMLMFEPIGKINTYYEWILISVQVLLSYCVLCFVIFGIFDKDFRIVFSRILKRKL